MLSGFTRKETLLITEIAPGNLNYLDVKGLVSPNRYGNPKRPLVVYSPEQIIDIRASLKIRSKLSLPEVGEVLRYLKCGGYDPKLFKCKIVLIDGTPCLVENWAEFAKKVVSKASQDKKGRISICEIGMIGDVVVDLQRNAEMHQIIDYKKRIIGTPLEAKRIEVK